VRYARAWNCLRPGGRLAFWSATHVFPEGGLLRRTQPIYEEIGEALPEDAVRPRPGELPDDREEIERSGLFGDVVVRHFDWELGYHAEAYIRLLDTFSGHIAMQRGNASGCTGRSDGDSRCDRADPAGTGARFCTSRVAAGGCPPDDGPAPGARDLRAR